MPWFQCAVSTGTGVQFHRNRHEHRKQINLAQKEWRDAIYEYLQINPQSRCLILDNIASLTPGLDENSKRDWDVVNQWLLSLRHLGITVIYVHHAGKSGQQRGSSAREDSLDNVIKLSRPSSYQDAADGAYFNISFEKYRNIPPTPALKPFSLRIIEDPSNPHSLIWDEGSFSKPTDTKKDQIMSEIIEGNLTNKKMALEFDVSPSRISQIRSEAKDLGYIDKKGHATEEGEEFTKKGKLGQGCLF